MRDENKEVMNANYLENVAALPLVCKVESTTFSS
jgi:hypothetical protein